MEKVIVFADYANLDASARENNCELDQSALLEYLASPEEGRFLGGAFAYVPIDPRQEHANDAVIDNLWSAGYVVKSKVGTIASASYKCNFDVEMTLDITRAAYDMRPDIVVLITGDSDFIPVVLNLREKGIRVEVAAFNSAMSRLLLRRCSGFICLDALANFAEEQDEESNLSTDGALDNPTTYDQDFHAENDTECNENANVNSNECPPEG